MTAILKSVAPFDVKSKKRSKVTVVGVGSVGMAAAFSLMDTTSEIALIDCIENKVKGEILDLQHGQQFQKRCHVRGGTDYKESADSDIVVITAGARQREGESRLELVQRNVDIFKHIIPEVVKYSPDCIIVVVSNPVDILTYVAEKLSGFPRHRVFGTGTMLDSARFRYLLGQKLGFSPNSVHGYIIGEHGDSSVPVWSNLNIAGVRLADIYPNIGQEGDPENFEDIHKEVVNSAYEIIRLKGYTSWAIGLAIRSLCNAILNDLHSVFPLSTNAKGIHGIEHDVCLSLPCLTTAIGINGIIPQHLNDIELKKIKSSADTLSQVINSIKW
ncbi:unnamed protein product [Calicophoron daubneyi]|uniref:L-lactate dehydrogenase n=1 Tax=Calicophoron daubneyi TaxID=300641 RepID=A0AAV2TI89_CALDB